MYACRPWGSAGHGGEARRLEDRKSCGGRGAKDPVVTTEIYLKKTWIEFLTLLIFRPGANLAPSRGLLLCHLGWYLLCSTSVRLGKSVWPETGCFLHGDEGIKTSVSRACSSLFSRT